MWGTPITAASGHHTWEQTCVFFFCKEAFSLHPPFPPASALLTKKTALWPSDLGFAVELREAEEQGCVVGGTVWPAVRREARVLHLWVQ